jgi:nucleoside-diphosphate-sugar epimerase
MARILITGSTGFIGQNLVRYLGQKEDVVIYSLDRQRNDAPNIAKAFVWDNLDDLKNQQMDVVIHLAGLAHDLKSTNNEEAYYEVNYQLTKQLFDLFCGHDSLKKFIYVSSVKAAADEVEGVLKEEIIPAPNTAYGKSKLMAEEYLKSHPTSKAYYILRPCMVYGPKNKGNLSVLYAAIGKGLLYPFGKFVNKRSYLSVDNLIFVFWHIIANQFPTGVYNVSDEEPISTLQVVELIQQSVGHKVVILNLPKSVLRMAAKVGDMIPFGLNTEKLHKIVGSYVVDSSKLLNQMNSHLPVSTETGMLAVFDAMQNKKDT